ncbi:MAG: hypothetical protein SVM86_03550 [Candidatus Cloacimonadota bacterium]|nr:hypothetical protein [Candidatus Cloacimonadota bacterium]
MKWEKFTVKGSVKIENEIRNILGKITDDLHKHLKQEDYKALILLGGYGRGEGGVVTENNREKPHNNFDLLLITKKSPTKLVLNIEKYRDNLGKISSVYDIGIDLGVISASKLKHSQCRLMWYEMRFGHKVLAGDKNFVSSLKHFSLKNVPAWDIRNLMVNRGTLMIVNDLLLEEFEIDDQRKKLIIKHIIKAIIGYGDALLFFEGEYSWSYMEKKRRMIKQKNISSKFKKIYNMAMEFRFQPNYSEFMNKDLKELNETLREIFSEVFRYCEQKRLGVELKNWSTYPAIVFRKAVFSQKYSVKSWLKKFIIFFKSEKYFGKHGLMASIGYRFLGTKGLLAVLFPYIAFKLDDKEFKNLARDFLRNSENFSSLRRSYLCIWSKIADTNFSKILKKYNIELRKKR